jgi:hypothetical protein
MKDTYYLSDGRARLPVYNGRFENKETTVKIPCRNCNIPPQPDCQVCGNKGFRLEQKKTITNLFGLWNTNDDNAQSKVICTACWWHDYLNSLKVKGNCSVCKNEGFVFAQAEVAIYRFSPVYVLYYLDFESVSPHYYSEDATHERFSERTASICLVDGDTFLLKHTYIPNRYSYDQYSCVQLFDKKGTEILNVPKFAFKKLSKLDGLLNSLLSSGKYNDSNRGGNNSSFSIGAKLLEITPIDPTIFIKNIVRFNNSNYLFQIDIDEMERAYRRKNGLTEILPLHFNG